MSQSRKDPANIGTARNECGKIAYDARWKAKKAEREGRKIGRDHMAAYSCADCGLWHLGHANRLTRHSKLKAQSVKRAREQRERAKMLREVFGPHPLCARCGKAADDAHELLSRARGGSITDPANITPLCRGCHSWVTTNPAEAEAEGWALHSWEDSA